MKIRMEDQEQKKEQHAKACGDRQTQEQNNCNDVLANRTQPNAASYHSR
jgi:hypothetical protein